MRSRTWSGAVIALMLLVAGCSSDQTSRATSRVGEQTGDQTMAFDAVLIELLGTTDTEQYLADTERRAAELVAACMEDAGFQFQLPDVIDTLEPPEPGDVTAAEARGFGIIDGARHRLGQYDLDDQLGADPNRAYVSTLSAAEIERFFETLEGPPAEAGQRSSGGCSAVASEEAYAEWQRFYSALPNYTVLGEERDTHPDWLAARSEWQACMLDRGFDYDEPDEIRSDVLARMRDAIAAVYPGGQVPVVEVDGVTVVDPEVDTLLLELAEFETAAAVANAECTLPLADRFDAVERMVQQEFVDRNRDVIDDLLAT